MIDPDAGNSEADAARQMVLRFLSLAGVEDPELTREAERLLHRQIAEIGQQGLRESDLAVLGQAYIRAVGRIVAAETEAISRVRYAFPDVEAQLEAVGDAMLPLGNDVFDVLHTLMLRRSVAGVSTGLDRSRRATRPAAIAHVDVIDSTALLERASLTDTQRLVDGLFASAQAAIRGRNVEVTKYVGDGVFLLGSDPGTVGAAALDCVASLASGVGLSSRAGLAFGRVVHRAGDVFGLTVNVSHRLTKSAPVGTLLAAAVAPAQLPPAMCTNPREISVRGLDAPVVAYEVSGL